MKKSKVTVSNKSDCMQPIAELLNKQEHKIIALWAADCAQRVLLCFEEKYPVDNRPRKAIEAARAWVRGEMKMTDARKAAFAAHAAARDAGDSAACAAARAAGHAAATAHVADHAIHSASYAVTAAINAAGTADADTITAKECDWQYQQLLILEESPNHMG